MPTYDFARLNNLLQEATRRVAPAVVCRVEQCGEVLFEAAYGSIDPYDASTAITPAALFDLASLTKLFTATACFRLCTIGALSLDSPITDILPACAGTRPIGPTEDPITKLYRPVSPYWATSSDLDASSIKIRHLLAHTSGLPAWRNVFSVCGDIPGPGYTLATDAIAVRQKRGIEAICDYAFAYPPGKSSEYSDIGFILLGAVVAAASATGSLDAAMHELLITPLALDACYNPAPDQRTRIAPTEYCTWRGRRLHGEVHDENAAGLGGISGHAGLFGSAADLCKLSRLYLSKNQYFLSEEIVRLCLECQVAVNVPGEPLPDPDHPCANLDPEIRRGLGWMLQTPRGATCGPDWSQTGFGHTGYTGTSLWCDPTQELAVALLSNRVYNGRDPEPIHKLRTQVHSTILRCIQ